MKPVPDANYSTFDALMDAAVDAIILIDRGGVIERLRYRNITVGEVQDAIVINYFYEEGDAGEFDPIVRDVLIDYVHPIAIRATLLGVVALSLVAMGLWAAQALILARLA